MGGHGERSDAAGIQACGSCSCGVADVLKAGRAGTTPQSGLDRGEEKSLGQLELDRVSARKKPPDKDSELGRQCPLGLRVAGMDETDLAHSEKCCKGAQTVPFRAHGIWSTVPETRCPSKT